jgi:F-type H+-transporting ATPase subunit b
MLQFDWTTFLLEILNFLVLLWILQRLLYKPILTMLESRQHRIEDEFARATQSRLEAEALHQRYVEQLAGWNKEQEDQRMKLAQELAELRRAELEKLKQNLVDEETKLRSQNEILLKSRLTALTTQASTLAYQQMATLLNRMASTQLTESILAIFLADLVNLPELERSNLQNAAGRMDSASYIEVISAHELSEQARNLLDQTLSKTLGSSLAFNFRLNPDLIAGLTVRIAEYQLQANLADELAFFRRLPQLS